MAVALGDRRAPARTARRRRRPRRRGDHEPDHLAGDGQRDRHCGAVPVFCDVRAGDLQHRPDADPGARHRRGRRRSCRSIWPGSRWISIPSSHSACRSSRTLRMPPRAGTAAARSGSSPMHRVSRSTRRRTSLPGRVAVATNREDVAAAIRSMRLTRRGDGSLYDQVSPGFKANLSDVLAAIALVQLDRVDAHAAIRRRQFALYDEGLAGLSRDPAACA